MFIVHVFVEVKEEYLEEFIQATIENAKASLGEPGIAKFDFLQTTDNPCHFLLNEVYRTKHDPARHKGTAHYKTWKQTVEKMMAVKRTKIVYANIFPEDQDWQGA